MQPCLAGSPRIAIAADTLSASARNVSASEGYPREARFTACPNIETSFLCEFSRTPAWLKHSALTSGGSGVNPYFEVEYKCFGEFGRV